MNQVRAGDLDLRDQIRLLSGRDFWSTNPVAGVPSVRMNDGPHGMRVQLGEADHLGFNAAEPATCFPTAVTLASSWDEDLLSEVGAAVAQEARALGVSLVLGPGLNIKRHPLCGRNFEYFSEDPLLSGRLAAAMTIGIQSAGVGACPKHFAANNAESHRFVSDSIVDPRTLHEIYLSAFEYVVRTAKPWAIMASYNLLNGVQVTEDAYLLTDVLRTEWGFDGLVVSDWGATADRPLGLLAGMDLEMPGGHRLSDREVLAAVADGTLDADAVRRCAQRVIDLANRAPDLAPDAEMMHQLHTENDRLARRAAAAGAVLLANDGILPLAASTQVALIGAFAQTPRYQGAGSSMVNAARVTTLCDALQQAGVKYTWARGYDPAEDTFDQALIDEAVAVAQQAPVAVVVIGLPPVMESEGFDREHLRLPRQHDLLVQAVAAVNPRTVVVLANGAPVLMPWRDEVAAVLECYLGGQAGGGAMADLLLGVSEPGGRLAETFPIGRADVASDPWFPGQARQVQYREGSFVGYRHHVSAGIDPMWAFGHGLGYARVEWEQATSAQSAIRPGEDVEVRVRLHNPSDRPTAEVVQIYRHDRSGVVLRPRRELVGFTKVHLAAGESREVTVQVAARGFAFFDTVSSAWQVPSGPVDLEVARSSAEVESVIHLELIEGVTRSAEGVEVPSLSRTDADFRRRYGRPLPKVRPVRPFNRNSTVEELATTALGARVRAAVLSQSPAQQASDPTTRLMIERSLEELPVRALATFAEGRVSWPVIDALLDALNGHPVTALRRLGQGMVGQAKRRLKPRV